MRTRTIHHRDTTIGTLDDGTEIELDFEPIPDVTHAKVGDKYVVAYLALDDDCSDPMTDSDGNGKLYTSGDYAITDDKSAPRYLGLESFGGTYTDPDYDLTCEGVGERGLERLKSALLNGPLFEKKFLEFCQENFEKESEGESAATFMSESFDQIDWEQTLIPVWIWGKYDAEMRGAWEELYAQGKIGKYLAVPVRYCSNRHGPGDTRIDVCGLDDANAVWVPGKDEIDNIKAQCWPKDVTIHWEGSLGSETDPLRAFVKYKNNFVFEAAEWGDAQAYVEAHYPPSDFGDLVEAARKYAEGCLKGYERWVNGDCYGCVVQIHDEAGVQISQDALWGVIGADYAREVLKSEFFDQTCAQFQKECEREALDL